MPKSHESSSEFEFSNENQQPNTTPHNRNVPLGVNSKKFRHQNFSKNIYIGTRNAERWDTFRSTLAFKNDVEFVSYLLKLAENDLANGNGRHSIKGNFAGLSLDQSQTSSSDKIVKGVSESSESIYSAATAASIVPKKVKKVQFQDNLNGIIRSCDPLPAFSGVHSKDPLSDFRNPLEDSTSEVLDCRIAEKIKTELCEMKTKEKEMSLVAKLPFPVDPTDPKDQESEFYDEEEEEDDEEEPPLDLPEDTGEALCLTAIKRRDLVDSTSSASLPPAPLKGTKKKTVKFLSGDTLDLKKPRGRPKLLKHDVRKAPQDGRHLPSIMGPLDLNNDEENEAELEPQFPQSEDEETTGPFDEVTGLPRSAICCFCDAPHTSEECPMRNAELQIVDSVERGIWLEQNQEVAEEYAKQHVIMIKTEEREELIEDDEIGESNSGSSLMDDVLPPITAFQDNLPTFADASLPRQFEFRHVNDLQCVFTISSIPKYTKLGPLIGKIIPATDIGDDNQMQYIIETCDNGKSEFISLENKNESNWMRYIRPAASRESRNLSLVCIDKMVFFVSIMDIPEGCELLYWSDTINSAWARKKIEKMSCGGCNLKFEHPLYYRTHCSVFHDPAFSLTIRKYHCKVCSIAVLGKENIMKHAAQMHDGKGAYQCQFCKKFFLRLNYLEMHRTYGCSANPQRARPLCDFCGRKFCQPQKLKVHIKRMHSDMADVLRDFQCKLCSKLLGSRAALQRHSKEVHSRNSAVVSCPRCQKLFQNRSNLKIHMLTHSGVRPFKCSENECNAAFTTKQCLQFHYKKVHGYSQEQMPKIERSIAYTFDAYSGGMKVDFMEQTPRRRRKSLEEGSAQGNFPEKRKYNRRVVDEDLLNTSGSVHKTSISDLCKNETNLSLLSSKISSLLNHELNQVKFRRRNSISTDNFNPEDLHKNDETHMDNISDLKVKLTEADNKSRDSLDDSQDNQHTAQLNLVESFLSSSTGEQSNPLQAMQSQLDEQQQQQEDDDRQSTFSAPSRHKDFAAPMNSSLIPSKGSKKWMNDQQNQSTEGSLMAVNRDFITRLMMNGTNVNSSATGDDEDSSTILDVVDNHPQNASQYDLQQMHLPSLPMTSHIHHQPFISSFYNGGAQSSAAATTSGQGGSGATVRSASATGNSTSASLLVEAALNSVSNIIDSGDRESCELAKNPNANSSRLEEEHELNSHMDVDIDSIPNEHHSIDGGNESGGALALAESAYHHHNNMSPLDNEVKLMKSLNNFQMSNMQQFSAPSTSATNQIIMADSPSVANSGADLMHDNDIDVDTASTPRTMDRTESNGFRNYHHPSTPSPRDISPGQDYRATAAMYAAAGNTNHVPSPQALSRRNYQSEQNAMMSPTASPPIPRYGFTDGMCRKREHDPSASMIEAQTMDRRENPHMGAGSGGQLSSDEDSIVIAQNLSVNNNNNEDLKMKMNPSMDLLYAKYEQQVNAGQDLADLRMKYNTNESTLDVSDFRGAGANSGSESMSEIQGLDMSSRPGLSGYSHHNFQISSAGANLSLNRYHHHIYDILSEREQQQQSDHHQLQLQQQMMLQDQMAGAEAESDQTTSVDLSRTTSYVVTSPPALPYSHPHSDMLRMVSLELNSNSSSGMIVGNNSHHGRSFLPSQIQHNSRDSLSAVEHHRLLSTAEQHRLLASNTAAAAEQLSNPAASLASNHRLIVDPATHLLMEPNNRLLSSENNRLLDQTSRILADSSSVNRHMVPSRDFGAYQVTSNNYHHLVRQNLAGSSPNQPPSNYHPFPAYY
ncbi:uncharacterized protein LOC129807026 isoform X2 [Phlebotomus papatasi]|uniref:uncharacterized protein LOC129807026 isoform X2 n=1 Tax=Phlebotomus papatasi TaxID=29031 RepID=UPI0024846240|nr:uncharacterized protein LOC129807026 isoform X2 [Phlebotomus papatasi]